ncbi:MAG: ECF transporter S component [Rectinema sp.]|nr:ECF transporter S component [Rectinema sp.]
MKEQAIAGSGIRKAIVTGALSAVSIALFLTPFGYIPWFAGASLTIMHVPAIIGAVLEGPAVGAIIGGIFGITSLIKAATAPQGPIDVFFTNPLVSILPRILVGLCAWAVFSFLKRINRKVSLAAAGLVGSMVNSVFVLGMLVVLNAIPFQVAAGVFIANSLVEAAAAAILTLGVVSAWKGVESRHSKARISEEE